MKQEAEGRGWGYFRKIEIQSCGEIQSQAICSKRADIWKQRIKWKVCGTQWKESTSKWLDRDHVTIGRSLSWAGHLIDWKCILHPDTNSQNWWLVCVSFLLKAGSGLNHVRLTYIMAEMFTLITYSKFKNNLLEHMPLSKIAETKHKMLISWQS